MPTRIDKVIVTNLSVLKSKYGTAGLKKIQDAVNRLIAADRNRGLETRLIPLDDARRMKAHLAKPVANAADPQQNKVAIDAIYKALAPAYLMILGAIDVIPHQDLKNPMYSPGDDDDKFAYGDLPYACEAPYSQKPQDFMGPTRVVGRLPDITGGSDPAYLVGLLQTAASYAASDPTAYAGFFGITAQIWSDSTALSLKNTFGNCGQLKTIPPSSYKWPTSALSNRSHFINCHGADTSSQFYGQPASGAKQYPVSHDAAYLKGKIAEGTVAAAECCYGGQLYNPALLQGQKGILNTYLEGKAYGFLASTTIAYGPSDGNGQADYICQYFLQNILHGASLGRAALQARQKFVQTASPPDPSDIKTLAQFNLYGDPSVTPVKVATPISGISKSAKSARGAKGMKSAALSAEAQRAERDDRRRILFRRGVELAANEPKAIRTRKKLGRSVVNALSQEAQKFGLVPSRILSFAVKHPPTVRAMPKSMTTNDAVTTGFHVLFGTSRDSGRIGAAKSTRKAVSKGAIVGAQPPVIQITALVAKEVGGQVVSVTRIHSR